MSMKLKMLMSRLYREANDGAGNDLGGATAGVASPEEVVDLGDELPGDKPTPVVVDPELTDEEKAALPPAKTDEELEAEAEVARDKVSGKFVKKEKTDTPMIPKARVDEMLQKERDRADAAERRAAEAVAVKEQKAVAETIAGLEAEASELRKQEHKALLDGNAKAAEEFSSQRDALNRKIVRMESQGDTTAANAKAIEGIRVDTIIEGLKADHPALDEKSDEFDQDLVDDILDKQQGYIARERLSPAAALSKAAKYVFERRAAPAPAVDPQGLDKARTPDRKAAAVAKNVAAAAAQPASLKDAGMDSDKSGAKGLPDINKMSSDEYDALPEATKARMRGDVL